jgi:hypothetical protein
MVIMGKRPNLITITFMVVLTIFISLFGYYLPNYFGDVKTFFFVLALISAVKTLTMVKI